VAYIAAPGAQPLPVRALRELAGALGHADAPMQIAQTNATLRNGLLRAAVSAIPNLAATFRRYSSIYAQLKPTLMSVGGMPAILAANLSLAENLDSWLQTNDLMQLLPFFTETAMQTVRHDILIMLDQSDLRDRATDTRSTAQQLHSSST